MTEKRMMWLRIARRMRKVIAELEQIIRDANYWNGLPHNQQYTPIDVEGDRVLLAKVKRSQAEFFAMNPEPEE